MSAPEVSPTASPTGSRPAVHAGVKPASYSVSILLVLLVAVGAEVVAEILRPQFAGEALTARTILLLGVGGAATLALLVLNARWLWVTVGNLRFALALITVWGVTSMLGTLVVQRFPNQTDEGYAKTFKVATGDFFYHFVHAYGGVEVRPAPDVEAWLVEQERLYGKQQGGELRKEWHLAERGRLRKLEIERFTVAHDELLSDILVVVSALRLPEAFQISVWFKALLALLCVALVIVVMQRWRGEWRQVGWVMAHFGMVIFVIGASVRATSKIDGNLSMTAGETRDFFFLKVAPERAAAGEAGVRVSSDGNAYKPVPLDFDVTLHRFKTEYPKHLVVSFPPSQASPQGASRTYLVSEGWQHPFLGDQLEVTVDRLIENAELRWDYREGTQGEMQPALLTDLFAEWLDQRQPVPLPLYDRSTTLFPPSGEYRVQYAQVADSAEAELLRTPPTGSGVRGYLYDARDGWSTEVRPGQDIAYEGRVLQLLEVVPDFGRRAEPDAQQAAPRDPAARFAVFREGLREGDVWVLQDHNQVDEGLELPEELLFEFDAWSGPAAWHYRLVGLGNDRLSLLAFRDGALVEERALAAGDSVALGTGGDRLELRREFQRLEAVQRLAPADTTGLTPEDVYYASLPTLLELTLRGPAVSDSELVRELGARLRERDAPASSGVVRPAEFEAGLGSLALLPDGSVRLRLLSDEPLLQTFPSMILAQAGLDLPFALNYFTNTRGAPLRFTSDLTLSRDGKPLKRDLVEPNQPLYLAGYQFSQADFDKNRPDWSGFGVVRDPSVRIVYTGMSILVLGVILLFYVNPLIAARRAKRGAKPLERAA
ncbi:MAG: cytochrome c biogenesis protein ResB [Planctomycetota bacterium]